MRNSILCIAIAVVLAAPGSAVAQNPSLNFQKIEQDSQKPHVTAVRLAAMQSYLNVKGQKQGKFKGESSGQPAKSQSKPGGGTGPTVPPKPSQGNTQK
jgi:hypothetical protein